MLYRIEIALTLAVLALGCGPAANSESSDITAGSRWKSPLDNGFYDGSDTTLRLYSAWTEQRFSLVSVEAEGDVSYCDGAIDWTEQRFAGDTCDLGFSSENGTLTLTEVAASRTLRRRVPGALDGTYTNKYGYQVVLSRCDDDGVDVRVFAPQQVFDNHVGWGDDLRAAFVVNSCTITILPQRASARFELNVETTSDCSAFFPASAAIEGIYR